MHNSKHFFLSSSGAKTFASFAFSAALFFSYSQPSQAFLEVRVGYTSHEAAPSNYNDLLKEVCASCGTSAAPMTGLMADVIFSPPTSSFGLGLRHESLSSKVDLQGLGFEESFSRLALLLNYRIWNTGFFMGPLVTYGVSNSAKLTVSGLLSEPLNAKSASSYSVGIEAGIKFGGLLLGAEIGQQSLEAKDLKTAAGDSLLYGNKELSDISRSGVASRVFIGFGF